MGTPNRLKIVLGTAKVDAKNLTVDEWTELIEKILSEIKPYLKYLDGYRSIDWATHSWKSGDNERFVPANVVTWPGEAYRINQATKVLHLTKFTKEGELRIRKPAKTKEFTLKEVEFNLCREGRIISTEFDFECTLTRSFGDLTSKKEEATSGHICLSSLENLKYYISQCPDTGYQVVSNLSEIINRTIEQRERRLQHLRGIHKFLDGIKSRVNR